MARAEDLAALEALVPWTRDRFRADLAGLRDGVAEDARALGRRARLLAGIARQVPRLPGDERGASPWVSFLREVAVASCVSDRAAAARVRCALRLTSVLPVTLAQLDAGLLSAHRAEAFVRELEGYDDDLASRLDALLGGRIRLWPAGRIRSEVAAAAARLDAEAVAARAAVKNADRSVQLVPDSDDQASVVLTGPAVPLVRWHSELDRRARTLRAAGDPRTLDQLRFDLAVGSFPCAVHVPANPTAPAAAPAPAAADSSAGEDVALSAFGLRPSFVEPAPVDCRRSRPVQANLTVPVETALGLANEPGWLDGYGWLSAPTCRLLLVDAELRRLCVQTGTGQLVQVDDHLVRPEPTPAGVRRSVLDMVLDDITLGRGPTGSEPGPPDEDAAWRVEPQHDPSTALARYVRLRDRVCDGPTQSWVPATRAHLDHERPYPDGPTAAWNLAARGQRTHLLKHYGWTPLRTPTSTIWTSPAGQVIEVNRLQPQAPGMDDDNDGWLGDITLPDPDQLHQLDRDQLTPPDPDDLPPWTPAQEHLPPGHWIWLHPQPDDSTPIPAAASHG